MIDVVIGKKKVKLSFFTSISPGNFLIFRSIPDWRRKRRSEIDMKKIPIMRRDFARSLKGSPSILSQWVRRESNPRPWD